MNQLQMRKYWALLKRHVDFLKVVLFTQYAMCLLFLTIKTDMPPRNVLLDVECHVNTTHDTLGVLNKDQNKAFS